MNNVSLLSPWVRYVGRVEALFAHDPEVMAMYDEAGNKLTLLVDDNGKAEAIEALMPAMKAYGNVVLKIEVKPNNEEPTEEDMYRRAFAGNSAFVDVAEGYGPAQDVSYALFKPEVVQLCEDDTSEFDGMTTMTYAALAKSVLDGGDVRISSSVKQ